MPKSEKRIEKEKKQLLRMMAKKPDFTKKEWTLALGWLNTKNNVDQTKITKRLKQLEADGLVIQIGHRYLINLRRGD